MIKDSINYQGFEYVKGKIIKSKNKTYVEYRNKELKKIKFFEVEKEDLYSITDEEDLKQTIRENYIVNRRKI